MRVRRSSVCRKSNLCRSLCSSISFYPSKMTIKSSCYYAHELWARQQVLVLNRSNGKLRTTLDLPKAASDGLEKIGNTIHERAQRQHEPDIIF
uniref:Uncharacterized protein n=1 Tax=Hyaloperonospora arabidopsidis (strain Emoy2) TaxID=559515 RepID=M4BXD0_HYAAE